MACDSDRPALGDGRTLKICRDPSDSRSKCQRITGRVLPSEELLRGERELLILHENQLYRLLRTRNGKLVLHK